MKRQTRIAIMTTQPLYVEPTGDYLHICLSVWKDYDISDKVVVKCGFSGPF